MTVSVIEFRKKRLVNTDPQRRCYNGCHASSELVWTGWAEIDYTRKPEERLVFWRDLNDYAISERGESARSEFRIKKEGA